MTYASAVDTTTYGEYRVPDTPGPLLRFTGRLGTAEHPAVAGRYHLYAGWFCPWSQRVLITRALAGLTDDVSVSYVDDRRDGRGWAFRTEHGPDPVNGFALLREAYEATTAGFDGHVSVPTLWDRTARRVVSNDYRTIGIDLATRFRDERPRTATYPPGRAAEIEDLDAWLGPAVNHGVSRAATDPVARRTLLDAFAALDARLADRRYLLGDTLTEADIRLWVTLVRYDVGPNATRAISPGLAVHPHLWAYARALYRIPAFRDTTRFASFTAPGATVPAWDEEVTR